MHSCNKSSVCVNTYICDGKKRRDSALRLQVARPRPPSLQEVAVMHYCSRFGLRRSVNVTCRLRPSIYMQLYGLTPAGHRACVIQMYT
jgi:hypothetical protein